MVEFLSVRRVGLKQDGLAICSPAPGPRADFWDAGDEEHWLARLVHPALGIRCVSVLAGGGA